MTIFKLCAFSLAVALLAVLPASGAPSSDAWGVYVATRPLKTDDMGLDERIYASKGMHGAYVRLMWDVIEPENGKFDWSTLDREAKLALKYGKKLSIGVRAGNASPTWLSDIGVKFDDFVVRHRRANCTKIRIPVDFGPTFIGAYGAMMQALAAHLKQIGAYDSVEIVKVTGMNERTEEMRLPSLPGNAQKVEMFGDCAVSNAAALWRSRKFTPKYAVDTWTTLAREIDRAFPGRVLSIPIIKENDFPSIDADGNKVPKWSDDRVDIKRAIFKAGLANFPGRLAVQWNGLNQDRLPDTIKQAKEMGTIIGLQSNMWRGPEGGAGCDADRHNEAKSCTDVSYKRILDFAVASKARFIEIWPTNATAFPGPVEEADKRLRAQ